MDRIDDLLKSSGLRITPTRQEVLSILYNSNVALSSQDLEEKISSDVDRITLYRTLKSFQEKGIIHKAIDGTDITRFAICKSDCNSHEHRDNHIHFHCQQCGNTFCMDHITIPELNVQTPHQVIDVNIIMKGNCETCQMG